MQTLIIIRGIPGSGKSTLARQICDNSNVQTKWFEADHYFEVNGEYKYDRERIGDAHYWCKSNVKKALNDGYDVVVSNTFIKHKEFQPYLEMTKDTNIEVIILEAKGNFKSIHDVPSDIIERMKLSYQP